MASHHQPITKQGNPTISIIIPTYQAEAFIGMSLQSCLDQRFRDFEVLVVNDGSTDSTPTILEQFQQQDCRIKVIHKPNEGVNMARKTGIDQAKGDYLFFLDADDTLPPDAIRNLYNAALEHRADIVAGNVAITELDGSTTIRQYDNFAEGTGITFLEFILEQQLHYLWGKLIRRCIYTDHKLLFRPEIVIGEDLIQLCQISLFAQTTVAVGDIVYHYIKQPMSATQKLNGRLYARRQELFALGINELQRLHPYNSYIQQQLNLRIIIAFHLSSGRFPGRDHPAQKMRKLLWHALYAGFFRNPSLWKSYKAHLIKGLLAFTSPILFYWVRRVFQRVLNKPQST